MVHVKSRALTTTNAPEPGMSLNGAQKWEGKRVKLACLGQQRLDAVRHNACPKLSDLLLGMLLAHPALWAI